MASVDLGEGCEVMNWKGWKDFTIKPHKSYYEIYFGKRLISTADTEQEAQADIEEYKQEIIDYIDTGVMRDWRTAVFFS